ncbi:MAG: YesL family protein [Oscillospiraceae bacterium]|nr:YesL family protein [Oscillospiraceae bacterium]
MSEFRQGEGIGVKKESKSGAALTAVIDIVTAGLLWLVCSLGVVTIGASSTALYYAVVKSIRHERGGLTKSFFKAFRRDFRTATLLWLLFLAAGLVFAADVWAFSQWNGMLSAVGKLLLAALLAFFPWVFAFVSRFSNTVGGTLKYCGYLALRNIGRTILMTLELLGFGLVVWLMPPLVFILPGLVCLLLSLHIEPVFRLITAEMTVEGGDDWFNE